MTTTIVGRGPSLLSLTREDFPAGPVITLNAAIIYVRELGLGNALFSMQKDGCIPHDHHGKPDVQACGNCPTWPMVAPHQPETLIVTSAESPFCLADYSPRIVVDVEQDFGLPWHTMSAPVAVRIAHSWGETDLLMLGHDAYVKGNTERWEPGVGLVDDPHGGYFLAGKLANEIAVELGMTITWR
jgi:hypothetical protein